MFHCELLSGLWIGDTDILNSEKFIKDNNISIVLNCTQLFEFPNIESLQKVRLPFSPIRESNTDIELLRNNYKKIVNFISEKIDLNNILICCYDGKSISPFLVALYIASKSDISKESIYEILLTKNINLDLWCDLSVFIN
jgi:protein-tyrosine phosphatase|tara:strand:- start:57 stop:476 length:420 start_codon:yes stop_codon:yes gene_type:complete